MKVIFLDVDGVLNSTQGNIYHNRFPEDDYHEQHDYWDPIAVSNLLYLTEEHQDIKFVISSTWRKYNSLEKLQSFFSAHGFRSDIVLDKTVIDDRIRGEQVQQWLNDNKHLDISHFVIIDDDADMGKYLNTVHFIRTSHHEGLIFRQVEEVLKYFGDYTLKYDDLIEGESYSLFSKPSETIYIFENGELVYLDNDGKKSPGVFIYKESELFKKLKKDK